MIRKVFNLFKTKEQEVLNIAADSSFYFGDDWKEREWTQYLAKSGPYPEFYGIPEYRCDDGSFVDIVTDSGYAAEVEWAKKWKESIGQCLLYSALLDKKPMIILLTDDPRGDKVYYLRLMVVAAKYKIVVKMININKEQNAST